MTLTFDQLVDFIARRPAETREEDFKRFEANLGISAAKLREAVKAKLASASDDSPGSGS